MRKKGLYAVGGLALSLLWGCVTTDLGSLVGGSDSKTTPAYGAETKQKVAPWEFLDGDLQYNFENETAKTFIKEGLKYHRLKLGLPDLPEAKKQSLFYQADEVKDSKTGEKRPGDEKITEAEARNFRDIEKAAYFTKINAPENR